MLVRREAGKASALAQGGRCGPCYEGWLLSRATRPPDPVALITIKPKGGYSAKPSSATNHLRFSSGTTHQHGPLTGAQAVSLQERLNGLLVVDDGERTRPV